MRRETITESTATAVEISDRDATALEAVGRRLAKNESWWGGLNPGEAQESTLVRCTRAGPSRYELRVADAIGVLATPEVEIVVRPKIEPSHFLYLLERSNAVPRLDEQPASLSAGESFFELVCRWFVGATERALRAGVVRDYQPHREVVTAAHGRVLAVPTFRRNLSGRLDFDCEFDDFGEDNPLNRMLLEAARTVLRMPIHGPSVSQAARRISERLHHIGQLRQSDLSAAYDRNSVHYRDALVLGKMVLGRVGRYLGAGGARASGFLIRTPTLIEKGVRAVLDQGLGPGRVSNGTFATGIPGVGFQPDCTFDGGAAVGDVKYKWAPPNWRVDRPDLYQAVAFAEASGAPAAAIFRFRRPNEEALPTLRVGKVDVSEINWRIGPDASPAESAALLVDATRKWLLGAGG